MNTIKIANKSVGKNREIFIIAEAGINHNGKLRIAKKLVEAAVDAKADAVKFQTFKSEGVVTEKLNQSELIRSFELKYNDFIILKEYCDKKNIIFLSTPHSFDAIDFLDDLVPAFKFGSGDLTNIPALQHAAKKGKPMILGTGMATLKEVKEAVEVIKKSDNNQTVALHCTTSYPCPFEEVNMNAMKTMQKNLDCLVGYSDHTIDITASLMAATLGAVIIEKHFTLDRKMPGPDQKASIEPFELKKMIEEIRNIKKALGSPNKKPTESERKIIDIVRRSIVAKKEIKKGTTITKDIIDIKRPGTGLKPAQLNEILGKKANRYIPKDELIQKCMVD